MSTFSDVSPSGFFSSVFSFSEVFLWQLRISFLVGTTSYNQIKWFAALFLELFSTIM